MRRKGRFANRRDLGILRGRFQVRVGVEGFMISRILTPVVVMGAFCFFACGANESASLTLSNVPDSLIVGNTSLEIQAVLKERNVEGQLVTTSPYADFFLVSSDTAVARIVSERFIEGLKAGTDTITGWD